MVVGILQCHRTVRERGRERERERGKDRHYYTSAMSASDINTNRNIVGTFLY